MSSEADEETGEPYDGFVLAVDDVDVTELIGGEIDWRRVSFKIVGDGPHNIEWCYEKDNSEDAGGDCAWIDEVVWSPEDPIPNLGVLATVSEVAAALEGSADAKLAENIKTAAEYAAYRAWALGLEGVTPQQVKDSAYSWLSFALDTDKLIEGEIADGDLRVEAFTYGGLNGIFDMKVRVADISLGPAAALENLIRAFVVEGAPSLTDVFSVEKVAVEFGEPDDGAVTFSILPREIGNAFFVRTRLRNQVQGEKGNGCEVSFNLNGGGSLPEGMSAKKFVEYTSAYGELPVPVREGYKFLGWFSAPEGGEKVDAESKMGFDFSKTLYAQWEKTYVYCVIDLSAGPNATSYAVSFLDAVPAGGWTDEYKTTKLVLRRIESGTLKIDDSQSDIAIDAPYCIGVFEVTQKQYELVTGDKPSMYSGDMLPVEKVPWDIIRGDSSIYDWPTVKSVDPNSFVGKLQARTRLRIDLPYEMQWEYACRAGATTAYSYGDSPNGDYMWYLDNAGNMSHYVGTRFPNSWGLFDMHGNVWERCLDSYSTSELKRCNRGGAFNSPSSRCISSARTGTMPALSNEYFGFRLAMDANVQIITFDANDGKEQSTIVRMSGDALGELPTLTREGYAFAGWWTAASGGTQVTASTVVTGSVTYYAHWEEEEWDSVQLWEGGPYWATTNIGAEKPEDYGYYFWWGDTVGYKRENDKWVASDGSNSNFSFTESNTPTYGKDNSILQSEGWITSDGVLVPEHDAAHKHWGGDWRMPTNQELTNLKNNCDWTWTTINGVRGYVVRGRGDYASVSIFLPCSGFGLETALYTVGSYGYYGSSIPDANANNYMYYLFFHSSYYNSTGGYRNRGRSVRPVQVQYVTVMFDVGGGSSVNPVSIRAGHIIGGLPVPTREGYVFDGWWTALSGGTQVAASTVVTGPQTLYARWKTREKVQLWENGPYWATTNIGAEKPEDYGYNFWWGDTVGYKRENDKWVASDGSSLDFSFDSNNTLTYGKDNSTLQSEGWITADGVLALEYDAAKKHWGGDWRMPTKQEFADLLGKCDWTWGSMNGVNGYVVCGRGEYASNSIFLPCAGYGYGTSLRKAGSNGYYWSSVPDLDNRYSWYLDFGSGYHSTYCSNRGYGRSVRPIQSMPCVIFDTCGGSSIDSISISFGQALGELPVSTREGYTFVGWFTAVSGGTQVTASTVVTADMQLYAHWTIKSYTVVFDANGGSGGVSKSYNHGSTLGELSVPTRDGYAFVGWFTAVSGGTQVTASTVVTADMQLYAHWTINSYTVVFDANGGSGGVSRSYNHGATLGELPVPTCDGYVFAGWWTAANGGTQVTASTVVTGSQTLYARWTIKIYSVVFDANGGSGGVSKSYNHGATLGELPIPTREGYEFVGWFTAASGGTQVTASTVVIKSQTLYARWKTREKVQLWEGGPYWATTNIGAEKPEDYGYYFWWGDTVGYKRENDKWVASDGSNPNFSFGSGNTPTCNKSGSTLQSEGWITTDNVLTPEHDAAHVQWGENWRMPTDQEFEDLSNKCDWIWTTKNGVNGYVVCGKGDYASNNIFLPCAGYGDGTSFFASGSGGYYWQTYSGVGSNWSVEFYFGSSIHRTYWSLRYEGQSIRPVQGEISLKCGTVSVRPLQEFTK